MTIKRTILSILFLSTTVMSAQLFAGIEIGGKGIKMSIIKIDNLKRGNYEVKEFWTENTGIARGISIDGNLAEQDIINAVNSVIVNYNKIKNDFKVGDDKIFVVGSSGVALAKNRQALVDRIKTEIDKDLEFIDASSEGKMLLRGCVPPVDYRNSMVLDIGGSNTKGGYIDVKNNDNFVFFPVSMDYGSVTLTEAVLKKTAKTYNFGEYKEILFGFQPTLRDQVKAMYASSPVALEKSKVYMSGGAVWAFYTLTNGGATKSFSSFTLEDVINYDAVLKNNFKSFEARAKTDKDVEAVLKTYSQKHLMSGAAILMTSLEAIPNLNEKKLFFANEGRLAWLVTYIMDKSDKIKKIY